MAPLRSIAVILACVLAALGVARAEIMISPLRQVLTPETGSVVYDVSNPSDRIVSGRVSWRDLSAQTDGYRTATPEERTGLSAAPFLSVEPASFRLEPGARTQIVIRLRNASLPAGERRSHLLIETDAVRTPLIRASSGLEVDIKMGVSTPVILRDGPVSKARRPDISFGRSRLLRDQDGGLELETHLVREGAFSSFGALQVEFVAAGAQAAKPDILARLDNVAVHADAAERRITMALTRASLPAGTLTIRYDGAGEYAGHPFASKSFEIDAPD